MRLGNRFLVSLAVMVLVFTISLAWAFRDDLGLRLTAALEHLRIAFDLKQASDFSDKAETVGTESDVRRGGIEKIISELIQLEKSKRELNTIVKNLKDEINTLHSEIDELEYVILEAKPDVEIDESQRDITVMTEDENDLSDEDSLVDESEPTEMPDSQFFADANDQIFNEYVDFYVNWLRDSRSIASENQKAYICRNSNVAQFLAVNEDAALREACNIAGFDRGITQKNVAVNQRAFLCRNLNVARFLSAFKNVSVTELCGR